MTDIPPFIPGGGGGGYPGSYPIENSDIAAAAAIAYTKLALANSITSGDIVDGTITNADINAAAGIAKSKLAALNIANADVANGAAIAQSKLALAITDAEVASGAAIAKSKLAALNIANSDVASGAAIAYSKLNLAGSITNSDIATAAAIALTKLGLPIGFMLDWPVSTIPSLFLACDGTAKSRTTYAALFAAIGTTWGPGDGSTTFNLPDLRGRTSIAPDGGAGRVTANNTLGAASGAQTHTLSVGEIPSHSHGSQVPFGTAGGSGLWVVPSGGDQGTVGGPAGGGGAHNNMQPYAVVNKIIYAGV